MPDDDDADDKLVLRELFDILRTTDVAKIEIEYDGSGDDSNLDTVWVYLADSDKPHYDDPVKGTLSLDPAVRERLETYCWGVLEARQEGWEVDHGACGSFTFDVSKGTMVMAHSVRVIQYEDEEEYELSI